MSKLVDWLLGRKGNYKEYVINGFTYHVEKIDPKEDEAVAYKLAELNDIVFKILTEIGRFLYASEHGLLQSVDRDVDATRLRIVYNRIRVQYNAEKMFESLGEYDNTSYVVNQGESIFMCVRGENKIAVLTVLIHELAHCGSESYEHTPEFWENYALLQKMVRKLGIVKADDIPKNGAVHCNKIKIEKGEMMSLAKLKYLDATALGSPGDVNLGNRLQQFSPSKPKMYDPSESSSEEANPPKYVPEYTSKFIPAHQPSNYAGYCPYAKGFSSESTDETPVARVSPYYINPMLNPIGLADTPAQRARLTREENRKEYGSSKTAVSPYVIIGPTEDLPYDPRKIDPVKPIGRAMSPYVSIDSSTGKRIPKNTVSAFESAFDAEDDYEVAGQIEGDVDEVLEKLAKSGVTIEGVVKQKDGNFAIQVQDIDYFQKASGDIGGVLIAGDTSGDDQGNPPYAPIERDLQPYPQQEGKDILKYNPSDLDFDDRLVYQASLPKLVPGNFTPQPNVLTRAGYRTLAYDGRGKHPMKINKGYDLHHSVPSSALYTRSID